MQLCFSRPMFCHWVDAIPWRVAGTKIHWGKLERWWRQELQWHWVFVFNYPCISWAKGILESGAQMMLRSSSAEQEKKRSPRFHASTCTRRGSKSLGMWKSCPVTVFTFTTIPLPRVVKWQVKFTGAGFMWMIIYFKLTVSIKNSVLCQWLHENLCSALHMWKKSDHILQNKLESRCCCCANPCLDIGWISCTVLKSPWQKHKTELEKFREGHWGRSGV